MQPKKQKSQRPPQPFAFRGITSKSTPSRYPSASLPRRKTSFDGFTMLSTTFTWSRLQTSSMTESKVGEATPVRPHSHSHSSRAHRGGLRHVIQLIVELPPAVCPARTLNAESRAVRTPWPWNIVSYASASRCVNASAVRYGPASRTMTRWPDSASFAAITEPPAPVPTTHTSAWRLVSLVGRRDPIETSDASQPPSEHAGKARGDPMEGH